LIDEKVWFNVRVKHIILFILNINIYIKVFYIAKVLKICGQGWRKYMKTKKVFLKQNPTQISTQMEET